MNLIRPTAPFFLFICSSFFSLLMCFLLNISLNFRLIKYFILFYFFILLSQKKHCISNMLSFCILPLCLMLSYDMMVILVSFWLFGLSFVYLLDILICIIRLFFLEKSPCICKVKRFIFIINYYLSGNIMWPVYLPQMWTSRHTCHLSFFLHFMFLLLQAPGGAAALHGGDVCITKFLIILRHRWMVCSETNALALKFAFVSNMLLSWIRISEWLDWSRVFYSQLAVDSHSVCGDPDSVLRVQGGCTKWPTGCLSSTCKPTTIALSTLSETYSGTAAEALTVHEQHVQTYSAEVPPLSSGTHLLGNLCSKFMWGQINQSFIRYCIILSKMISTL